MGVATLCTCSGFCYHRASHSSPCLLFYRVPEVPYSPPLDHATLLEAQNTLESDPASIAYTVNIPYSLKFSRIEHFAVLLNSAQNQSFVDKIFVV